MRITSPRPPFSKLIVFLPLLFLPVLAVIACNSEPANETEAALIERARAVHERVITLDTHNDINAANFTAERNYTTDLGTQVNLPNMEAGGLDVSWMIVYVGQGPLTEEGYADAHAQAIAKFDAIHRLTEDIAPDRIELALTSADVRRIAASGKKMAMIGIEMRISSASTSTTSATSRSEGDATCPSLTMGTVSSQTRTPVSETVFGSTTG